MVDVGKVATDAAKIMARLDSVDGTLEQVLSLVGTGATLFRIVGGLVRGKMSPEQQATFDAEIANYDAQRAKVLDAITEFRKEFGGTSSLETDAAAGADTTSSSTAGSDSGSGSGPTTSHSKSDG